MGIDDFKGKLIYSVDGNQEELEFIAGESAKNAVVEIKTVAENLGKDAYRLKINLKALKHFTIKELYLETDNRYRNGEKVFVNGFQSWTETREYALDEKIEKLSKLVWDMMSYYGDYTFYPYSEEPGYFHGFTYSYLRKINSEFFFIGSLDENSGYTIIEHKTPENLLRIKKDCATILVKTTYDAFDLIIAEAEEKQVFDHYFQNGNWPKPKVEPTTGWTSWYYHYTDISEKIVLENLKAFNQKNVPIDIFQIDDGYQKAVGDWLTTNDKFPNGMKSIADAIHNDGYKAGLWLAPFICEYKSDIFKNNPGWLLTYDEETPVKVGYNPNWGGISHGSYYALDFYNENVKEYLKKVFDTVLNDWGFDMVKLDFLFAAAIIPQHNKSRGQVMSEVMRFLNEICGDKLILGCGVPLGPSFGHVDYCRIGCDMGLSWELKSGKMAKMRETISTVASIKDSIHRRHLNGNVFLNDPDVFILRDKKVKLKDEQKHTLFLINHLFGGLVFTSDDISEYNDETLDLYLAAFPHREKIVHSARPADDLYEIEFSIGKNEYLLFANLSNKKQMAKLPGGKFYYREFGFITGHSNTELDGYQSRCFLKVPEEPYRVAGSNIHIFPGSEVGDIIVEGDKIDVAQLPNTMRKGTVYITVPDDIRRMTVNGKERPTEVIYGVKLIRVET